MAASAAVVATTTVAGAAAGGIDWLGVSRDLLISGWIVVFAFDWGRRLFQARKRRLGDRALLRVAVGRMEQDLEMLADSPDWRHGSLNPIDLGARDLRLLLDRLEQRAITLDETLHVERLAASAREVQSLMASRTSLGVAEATGQPVSEEVSHQLNQGFARTVLDALCRAGEGELALAH